MWKTLRVHATLFGSRVLRAGILRFSADDGRGCVVVLLRRMLGMRKVVGIGFGREPRWRPPLTPTDRLDVVRRDVRESPDGAGKKRSLPGPFVPPLAARKSLAAKPLVTSRTSSTDEPRWKPKQVELPFASDDLHVPTTTPRRPRRDDLRDARARRRQDKAANDTITTTRPMTSTTSVAVTPLTRAEIASIAPATREWYTAAHLEFEAWMNTQGSKMLQSTATELDATMVTYLDELFLRGEDAGQVRAVIFGTIFCRSLPKGGHILPRCRRALKGFLKDCPPVSNDPVPIEAAVVLADALLDSDKIEEQLAGLAFVTAFDLFTRPSETLEIRKEDVIAPRRGQYQGVSIIIAPSALLENRLTAKTQKAAKSGEYDDTVIAGLPGLGLEWIPQLLWQLACGTPAKTPIFAPLSLASYERIVVAYAKRLELGRVTPHSARHGGPSLAMLRNILDARAIQKRGRWLAPASVRRYEKSGKLTRQAAKLSAATFVKADALLRGGLAKKALGKIKKVLVERRCLFGPARPTP